MARINANPIDIRRVAEEAGVSIATVSRVLNNPSRVSESTRAKVLEVAAQLSYRPNSKGQRLRTGRAEAIGMVFPTPHGRFGDPFFLELLAGVGESLNQAGLDLLITPCPAHSNEVELYQRLVQEQKVDGFIVARTRQNDARIQYLLEQQVPFVAHGRSETSEPFAWLDIDGEHGFFEATSYLAGLGHRHIALINAPQELMFAHHRLAGYRKALKAHALKSLPQYLKTGDLSEASGFEITQELLALPTPPSAILCANDPMALGALHALRERGLEAGREVSVIGYDDIPLASYSSPPLTTLHQPIRAAGHRLVEMLLSQIQGSSASPIQELWLPELVVRSSTGRP